jgi:hypothetical protein
VAERFKIAGMVDWSQRLKVNRPGGRNMESNTEPICPKCGKANYLKISEEPNHDKAPESEAPVLRSTTYKFRCQGCGLIWLRTLMPLRR